MAFATKVLVGPSTLAGCDDLLVPSESQCGGCGVAGRSAREGQLLGLARLSVISTAARSAGRLDVGERVCSGHRAAHDRPTESGSTRQMPAR